MSLSPPTDDDSTQPIAQNAFQPLAPVVDIQQNIVGPSTAVQSGTLPSMAFEAANKSQPIVQTILPPPAFPFSAHQRLVSEYHEPEISQTMDTDEDDVNGFGRNSEDGILPNTNLNSTATSAPPNHPSESSNSLIHSNSPNGTLDVSKVNRNLQTSPRTEKQETSAPKPPTLTSNGVQASNTSNHSNSTHISKSTSLEHMEVPKAASTESSNPGEVEDEDTSLDEGENDATPAVPSNGNGHSGSKGSDDDRLNDMDAMNQSLEDALVDRSEIRLQNKQKAQKAQQSVAKSTRNSRKRQVSASQGIQYDYCESGTLQHESDDEDDFFGDVSDDERGAERNAKKRKAPTSSHSARASQRTSQRMEVIEDVDDSQDEKSSDEEGFEPKEKKAKIQESTNSVQNSVHSAVNNAVNNATTSDPQRDDDEVRTVDESDDSEDEDGVEVVSGGTAMDSDFDRTAAEPVSKPRPSLGGVGTVEKVIEKTVKKAVQVSTILKEASKKTASTTTKASVPSSKKSTSSNANVDDTDAVEISDEETSETTSKAPKKNLRGRPKASSSKPAVFNDEVNEDEVEETPQRPNSSKKKHAEDEECDNDEQTPTQSKRKSTPRKATPPPASKSAESTPNKIKSPTSKTSTTSKVSKIRQKASEDLVAARDMITAFLNEQEDMAAYYTQVGMSSSQEKGWNPPNNLFSGVSFIVTGLRHVSNSVANPSFIKQQIKALGGKVINFRTEVRRKLARRPRPSSKDHVGSSQAPVQLPAVVLLSEKPQRTLKYISALAGGVPCVHYGWFFACLSKGGAVPLDSFLLPAGYDETSATVVLPLWITQEDQSNVPIHEVAPFMIVDDGDTTGDSADPARIEVIGTSEFRSQWETTLKSAGAKIVQRLSYLSEGRIDYILSDSEPTDLSLRQAAAIGMPLCTIDWALQTIIQRKLQDPLAYPAYRLEDVEE